MSIETKVERDRNVLTGEDMARIRYRRNGDRRWRSVLVELDEATTYDIVEANAAAIVLSAKLVREDGQ